MTLQIDGETSVVWNAGVLSGQVGASEAGVHIVQDKAGEGFDLSESMPDRCLQHKGLMKRYDASLIFIYDWFLRPLRKESERL